MPRVLVVDDEPSIREIVTRTAVRAGWTVTEAATGEEALDALDRLNGRPFDLAWSKAMIRHHRGAIAMARDVLLAGTNKQIRTLAHNVITAQRREIGQLRAVIGSAQP